MFCKECGAEISDKAVVCVKCGVAVKPSASVGAGAGENGPKSKSTYFWLAIILGSLGVHNFYSGHTKLGVIKLVVSILTSIIMVGPLAMWGWAIYEAMNVKEDVNGVAFI